MYSESISYRTHWDFPDVSALSSCGLRLLSSPALLRTFSLVSCRQGAALFTPPLMGKAAVLLMVLTLGIHCILASLDLVVAVGRGLDVLQWGKSISGQWRPLEGTKPLLVPRMPFRVVCVFETRVSFNLGWLQIGQ